MNNLAPIVLFVYNRLDHTQKTIQALQENELAIKSDLIIYSDGPKNQTSFAEVNPVRQFLKTIEGFKSVKIVEREENIGLAANIMQGVTAVINEYGKVIVVEDDIVTSPKFLTFMNSALDHYKDNEHIWHISGWNYPVKMSLNTDVFIWRVMNCWGWATWKNKWSHFEKNPQKLINEWPKKKQQQFDLDGSGMFWHQVTENANGNMNTWAIFWYASIFENGGLCLNPCNSYVENIGLDGSGENCGKEKLNQLADLNRKVEIIWPDEMVESKEAVEFIQQFYLKQKKSIVVRAIKKLARIIIKRNIFK